MAQFIDDMLIISRTFEEHLARLREVFTRLRNAMLRLKPKKCNMLRDSVVCLGHVISTDGICPDSAKTKQVRDYPYPTDATKVRQFVGLASFYRRFIPNFTRIAAPLHSLTKKCCVLLDPGVWGGFSTTKGVVGNGTGTGVSTVWCRADFCTGDRCQYCRSGSYTVPRTGGW